MAMSARAKWMATIISDIFSIGEYDAHVTNPFPLNFIDFNPNVIGTFQKSQASASL